MKFIELTMHPTQERLLLNTNNIASIYSMADVTVIQEITSADNYWDVKETIDEVIALIDECRNTDKKGDTNE